MKILVLSFLLIFIQYVSASPSGSYGGTVIAGPSGVVTDHGPIGPSSLGLGYGGHGHGAYIGGPGGSAAHIAGPVAPPAYITGPVAPPAYITGPVAPPAYITGPVGPSAHITGPVGPTAYLTSPVGATAHFTGPVGPSGGFGSSYDGYSGGFGSGNYGGYGAHSGIGMSHGETFTNGGGLVGVSHHGVTVKGPQTVPATITGPAGKVVADGLYGVPSHHYGHHGW